MIAPNYNLKRRRVVVPRHGAELVRIGGWPRKSVLARGFGPMQHQVVPVDRAHHEHGSSPVDAAETVQLGVPEESGALLAVGWDPRDAYGVGHLLAVHLHIFRFGLRRNSSLDILLSTYLGHPLTYGVGVNAGEAHAAVQLIRRVALPLLDVDRGGDRCPIVGDERL